MACLEWLSLDGGVEKCPQMMLHCRAVSSRYLLLLLLLLLLIYIFKIAARTDGHSDVRSEVLCFLQNNLSITNRANLITWLCGFYDNDELIEAKSVLFSIAEDLKVMNNIDIRTRNVTRRMDGESRRKADSADLLDLWAELDVNKQTLPTLRRRT